MAAAEEDPVREASDDSGGDNGVVSLDVSGSRLSSFEPEAVFELLRKRGQSLPRSLEAVLMIDMSNNAIQRLPRGFGRTFGSIIRLNMQNNRIASLDRAIDCLTQAHSLRYLYLKNCTNSAATADPKGYVNKVGARLCGVVEIDGVLNPHALNEAQRQAADDLFRFFGASCNALDNVNLAGKNIHLSEFMSLLELLRALPVRALDLTNNPVCTAVHNYRLHVIYALPSLITLDSMRITDDERGNAHRIIGADANANAGGGGAIPNRGFSTSAGYISMSRVSSGVSAQSSKVGPKPAEGGGLVRRAQSAAGTAETPKHPSGNTAAAPSVAAPEPAATPQQGPVRFKIQTLFGLDSMAAAPPGDDFREPLENIWGTTFLKLELLVDFLQLYVIVSSFQVDFPNVWETFNEGDESGGFVQGVLGQDVENLGDYWSEFSLPDWAKHVYFFFLMALPLWLWFCYKRKPQRQRWIEHYVTDWGRTKWRIVLSYAIVLISIVAAGLGWRSSPSWVSWLYLTVGVLATIGYLIAFLIIWSFRAHQSDMKWWYRYIELRKRACLFGVYELYTPIARVILQTWQAAENDDGEKVLRRFDDTEWPFSDSWSFREHWPMAFAAFFFLVYVIGIPAFFAHLIFVGAREAEQNFGVRAKLVEIKALKMDLQNMRKKERTLQRYWILQREESVRWLYGHAVRKYRTPQTSLFEDYRREGKYFKVAILYWKVTFLFLAFIVTNENTDNSRIDSIQSGVALLIALSYLLVTMLRRPYHALNENVIQALSAAGVTINCLVAYMIANSAIDIRKEYSLTLLFVSNVTVIAAIVVIMVYAPILAENARIQRRRMERQLTKAAGAAGKASLASSPDSFRGDRAAANGGQSLPANLEPELVLRTATIEDALSPDDANPSLSEVEEEYPESHAADTFDSSADGVPSFQFLKEAALSLAETLFPDDEGAQQAAVGLIHVRIGELSEIMKIEEEERSKLLEEFYESICEQVEDTLSEKVT